jgi:toluene monooxygenase system ferredoxin subunit
MARELLCKLTDVPADSLKEVKSERGRKVCVIRAGDAFYACQSACPHEGFALCDGVFDGTTLTCLEHFWQWDIRSGEPMGRAEASLRVFPIAVDGDAVYIES